MCSIFFGDVGGDRCIADLVCKTVDDVSYFVCLSSCLVTKKKTRLLFVVSASFSPQQERPKFLNCTMCIISFFAHVVDYRLESLPYSCSMVHHSLSPYRVFQVVVIAGTLLSKNWVL